MAEFQEYPKHLHKPGGEFLEVQNEEEQKAAQKKGWKLDLKAFDEEIGDQGGGTHPWDTSLLTVAEAMGVIEKANPGDLDQIAGYEADRKGGPRKGVMEAIADRRAAVKP